MVSVGDLMTKNWLETQLFLTLLAEASKKGIVAMFC